MTFLLPAMLSQSPEKEGPVTLSSPDLSEGLGSNSFPETPDYAMLVSWAFLVSFQ